MTDSTILTIVLNYKTPDMTLKSVRAALLEMEGIAGELIVVDNDSQDGSFEQISKAVTEQGWDRDGRVRVIQSGHNGGFGAGNNVGIRAGLSDGTAPDYVYLLNSDAFPDPGAIRLLQEHLDTHPETGFVGSYIHGEEGEVHHTAFRFPGIFSELEFAVRTGPVSRLLARYVVAPALPEKTCPVDWVAGASLMMRQNVLDEIGLFDERFFLYFEETDLCRRAKLAGWPTTYVRTSEVTHIGSVSTGMKQWARTPSYWFDSRLHYFVKNHGALYALIATAAHILGGTIWRFRCLIQRKPVGGPPGFLKDLITHLIGTSLRAVTGRLPSDGGKALPDKSKNPDVRL